MTEHTSRFIGRFKILEKLGEGGMAVVWKAHDPELDRIVAVKMIRTPFPSEKMLKRFEREARALSQLSHQNIIKIFDHGQDEGRPFFVMEYIPGGKTLRQQMGKPLVWQDAARLLLPVAHAIAYAHEKKIIHRDIKPSNILVDPEGNLKLADFGVVKFLSGESTSELTSTGVGVGTVEYMAPEQMLGQETDGRADIYALGCIFFELVTGKRPFQAASATETMLKKVDEAVPRPSHLQRGLPHEVELLILSAMAKDASDRLPKIQLFVQALERFAQGSQKIPYRLRRTLNRLADAPSSFQSMILGGLVTVLIIAGGLYLANTEDTQVWFQQLSDPGAIQVPAQVELELSTVTAPPSTETKIATASMTLTVTPPASSIPEFSKFAIINEQNIGQIQLLGAYKAETPTRYLSPNGFDNYRISLDFVPRFSSDGRYSVVNDPPGRKIIDTFTFQVTLTEEEEGIDFTAFSPDGHYYASISIVANTVSLWDTTSWSLHRTFALGERVDDYTPPHFVSLDDKLWLILSAGNSESGEQFFWVFDVDNRSLKVKKSIAIDPYFSLYMPNKIGGGRGWGSVDYPPSGNYALITNAKFEFGINKGTNPLLSWFDLFDGSVKKQVEVPSRLVEIISVGQPFGGKPDTVIPGRDNLSTPEFSPNGKYVAVGFREVLWLGQIDQCTGEFTGCAEPSMLLPAVANRYRGNVVFSPSEEYVTYGGRVWRLKDGKAVFTVGQSAYWLDAGGWTSRNGKIVGLNTATGIAFLDLEKLVVSLEVEGNTISTGCWECAFSADDQLFVSKQGEILRVRNIRNGKAVFTFHGIPNVSLLSFSPDGRFLIVINSVTEDDYTVNFWGIPKGD